MLLDGVVVATHDPDRSAEVATRALRMENGLLLGEDLALHAPPHAVEAWA
jgi:hypothetical protein